MTGGPLDIQPGAVMDLNFINPDVAPSSDEPFWDAARRWSGIVRLTGPATNPSGIVDFAIDNGPYAGVGYFDTTASTGGLGVDLIWTPGVMPGDANVDNVVNIFDINFVSSHWGEAGPAGDANHDGIVNVFDVNLVSSNWTGGGADGVAAVPEPGTWVLAMLAASVLWLRRQC